MRTTRDRIARNARTNSGERLKGSFVRYPGACKRRGRIPKRDFFNLLTGRRNLGGLLYLNGGKGAGWGPAGGKHNAPHPKREALTPFIHNASEGEAIPKARAPNSHTTKNRRGPYRRARFNRTPRTMKPAPNRRARFNPGTGIEADAAAKCGQHKPRYIPAWNVKLYKSIDNYRKMIYI